MIMSINHRILTSGTNLEQKKKEKILKTLVFLFCFMGFFSGPNPLPGHVHLFLEYVLGLLCDFQEKWFIAKIFICVFFNID